MSNRLFQGVIHQMKDAVDRTIGVIDETGVIIACSELVKIGEVRQSIRDELAYTTDVVVSGGCTYRPLSGGTKREYIVFVEGDDDEADKISRLLCVSLTNIKNLYDEKYDKGSFIKNIILENILNIMSSYAYFLSNSKMLIIKVVKLVFKIYVRNAMRLFRPLYTTFILATSTTATNKK